MSWMIYGAYGYTGELIARRAKAEGQSPILAGRNKEKTEELAKELGMDFEIFSLDNQPALHEALSKVQVVVNCAGPFSQTFNKMSHACLETKTHYLDITGEIGIFEQAKKLDSQAKEAGIVVCPGTGFDVVPTDCLAAKLKELMPDATHLKLGFQGLNSSSAGTAKTTVEGISQGGKIRENGEIKTIPLGSITRLINFGKGERLGMAIPWGDVSTAYHSTGIPNIEVYVASDKKQIKSVKLVNFLRPLLSTKVAQNFLKSQIEKKVKGPDTKQRKGQTGYIWGEVTNSQGKRKECRIQTANGYDLTAQAPIIIANHLMNSAGSVSGYHTPSTLMGVNFVTTLEGSTDWQCD